MEMHFARHMTPPPPHTHQHTHHMMRFFWKMETRLNMQILYMLFILLHFIYIITLYLCNFYLFIYIFSSDSLEGFRVQLSYRDRAISPVDQWCLSKSNVCVWCVFGRCLSCSSLGLNIILKHLFDPGPTCWARVGYPPSTLEVSVRTLHTVFAPWWWLSEEAQLLEGTISSQR